MYIKLPLHLHATYDAHSRLVHETTLGRSRTPERLVRGKVTSVDRKYTRHGLGLDSPRHAECTRLAGNPKSHSMLWLKHWPALRTSQWIQHYAHLTVTEHHLPALPTHKRIAQHALHPHSMYYDSRMLWHAMRSTPLCRWTTYTCTSSPPTQPLTYWTGQLYQTQLSHTRYHKHHCAMACTCTAISTW